MIMTENNTLSFSQILKEGINNGHFGGPANYDIILLLYRG